jgi:hypothetical protein
VGIGESRYRFSKPVNERIDTPSGLSYKSNRTAGLDHRIASQCLQPS